MGRERPLPRLGAHSCVRLCQRPTRLAAGQRRGGHRTYSAPCPGTHARVGRAGPCWGSGSRGSSPDPSAPPSPRCGWRAHHHSRDLANIPSVYVAVERRLARSAGEESLHVRHGAHVPTRNRAMRRLCGRLVGAKLPQRGFEVGFATKYTRLPHRRSVSHRQTEQKTMNS